MPEIAITAVITDGEAVLVREAPDGSGRYALPRYPLRPEDETVEQALEAQLRDELGLTIVRQEFLETVYERSATGRDVVVNNLQLVTKWRADSDSQVGGRALRPLRKHRLLDCSLAPGVEQAILPALGIERIEPRNVSPSGKGRIILLGAESEPHAAAAALCASLGWAALVSPSALAAQLVGVLAAPDTADVERVNLSAVASLASTYCAAGVDTIIPVEAAQRRLVLDLIKDLPSTPVYACGLVEGCATRWDRDVLGPEDSLLLLDVEGLSADDTAALILESLPSARVQ
jgi:hypothetical protein